MRFVFQLLVIMFSLIIGLLIYVARDNQKLYNRLYILEIELSKQKYLINEIKIKQFRQAFWYENTNKNKGD